jgi:hypothetical protein
MQTHLQLTLAMIAQRTMDEDVRVRWFRGPLGQEMTRLAGPIDYASNVADGNGHPSGDGAEDQDAAAASEPGTGQDERRDRRRDRHRRAGGTRRLGELFARIGASSRAEATALAFRQRVL